MKIVLSVVVVIGLLIGVFFVLNTYIYNEKQADTPTVNIPEDVLEEEHRAIVVTVPAPEVQVSNPVMVAGEARGYWFFEASAPVVVVDWDGRIIGEGYITAEGDWMTENFVPFKGLISYELPADSYSNKGAIILKKDNPSGLPERDASLEIPVILQTSS